MLILTLNTHSLLEESYEEKLSAFAEYIALIKPDVIALQEVNQSALANETSSEDMGYAVGSIPIKEDNHALKATRLLRDAGEPYSFVWTGIKNGYGRFDEGLAIMSREPMEEPRSFLISSSDDYTNWRTRKALAVRIRGTVFCTSHFGWWADDKEPFKEQFIKLNAALYGFDKVYLMGDFNCPDSVEGEGYSLVCSSGWYDTYNLALQKDGHHTAKGGIAGWESAESTKLRIDYIFAKEKVCVKRLATVFDATRGPVVSDHFGVMADIKGGIT